MKDFNDFELRVKMLDGSVWAVPVSVIAEHRAKHFACEFGGDAAKSMKEDTGPSFFYGNNVKDWAANNMDWDDVKGVARKIYQARPPNLKGGWQDGHMRLVQVPFAEDGDDRSTEDDGGKNDG